MTTTAPTGDLEDLYRDLHGHPELGFQEHRTAGIVAGRLTAAGFELTTGIGGTGVVGIMRNGDGPMALLRADMDALPVLEETGLPYASAATGTTAEGRETPVMHACGHDMHVTCLLGACELLANSTDSWSGTLMVLFQPAEETVSGAQAMVDDGLFERLGKPDVVLAQHVAPIPAGVIGLHPGPMFAASDALRVTLYGTGGHGSRPEACVDPIVMGAAIVMRLQTIVSRVLAATETAVVTVGAFRAGSASNIIPSEAELLLTVRTFDVDVRRRVLAAIDRIVHAEATASGAPKPPDVVTFESTGVVVNDPDAVRKTRASLESVGAIVVDPGPASGSEDAGVFATAADAPIVYWLLGSADPAEFEDTTSIEAISARVADLPANHSPKFAPLIQPTLDLGVAALVAAARCWLPQHR
jgi:hippurate hydrolase